MASSVKVRKKVCRILTILDVMDQISDSDTDFDSTLAESSSENFPETNQRLSLVENEVDADFQDDEDYESESKRRKIVPSPSRGLKDSENPMETLSDHNFEVLYRFNKETIKEILNMISYGLTKCTNRGQPVSPIIELLITLQFLTTGTFQSKSISQVSQPTICRILKKVTTLLSELRLRFIKIPERSDFKNVSDKFFERAAFPEAFGCVGATHIAIKSPGRALSDGYLNEKGFYSFRTLVSWFHGFKGVLAHAEIFPYKQIICGPNLEFFEIISRWPGATHENKIFNISEIHQRFEYNKMDGVLLADYHYANRNFVLAPVEVPRNHRDARYNEAHRRTYAISDAVDLWKRRFKCLQTVLNHKEGMIVFIARTGTIKH